MADDRHIEIYNVFYKTNISVKKTTTNVVLKVGRKETERVARESGDLGAKPPAGSRGRAPGITAAELGCHLCCNVVDTAFCIERISSYYY